MPLSKINHLEEPCSYDISQELSKVSMQSLRTYSFLWMNHACDELKKPTVYFFRDIFARLE